MAVLTSVFVLVGLATVAPPTCPSHGDEDTDRSVDVGTTGCYIPPKYAHVRLRRSQASYSMNSQPVQRLWKLTACRQAVGTCTFSAVGATGCYISSKYAQVHLRRSHASYSMNSLPVQRLWKSTACRPEEVGHAWPFANRSLIRSLVKAFVKVFGWNHWNFRTQHHRFSGETPVNQHCSTNSSSWNVNQRFLINIPKA